MGSVRTFFFTLQVLARAVVPSLVRSLKHPKSAERTPLQWLEDARKEQFEQTGEKQHERMFDLYKRPSICVCVWMILYRSGEFWMCCIIFFIFLAPTDLCVLICVAVSQFLTSQKDCSLCWGPCSFRISCLLAARQSWFFVCFGPGRTSDSKCVLYLVILLANPCLLMQAAWDFEVCRW